MTASHKTRRVAVVGGGVTGLAAAHAIAVHPQAAAGALTVDLFESEERLGGKLRTSPFAGHPAIDEGPDAFLARLPWGTALAREVGLGEQLVAPSQGSAAVWWGGLHPIPEGLVLGMPTGVVALARSRLLTWPGKLRAAIEPLLPRTALAADSLGAFVRARFGDQVHERLVDPLVGSIYAADTDHFSLTAVPQIHGVAAARRSVLLAARKLPKPPADAGPVFYAPREGMGTLAAATAEAAVAAGARLHPATPVGALERDGSGWRVDGEPFDAVVLACPAAVSGGLLADAAPEASAGMTAIPAADVAIVSLALHERDWPTALRGMSGYLVPKPQQQLVTAASFGSQKWPHWQMGDTVIVRVSMGRDGLAVLHRDDEQLVAAAVEETGHHLGLTLQPSHARVSRWAGAFPQYRPHHAARVAAIEGALPRGVYLAGASYHGVGVPACIASARNAAARAVQSLFPVAQ